MISKQEISEISERTEAVLSKREPLVQNGRIRTYTPEAKHVTKNMKTDSVSAYAHIRRDNPSPYTWL